MILRRIARPMLAAVFVSGGIDTLRNPKPRVDTAAPVIEKAGKQANVAADPELLVKVNAAAQVAAGTLLGLGKFPRLSALVLAGSLAPTTVAGHRFWEEDQPADRGAQRIHFLKNLGLIGGLLIAASDTHGKPSLAWRAKHAKSVAGASVGAKLGEAAGAVQGTVGGAVAGAAGTVQGAVEGASRSVKGTAKSVTGNAKSLKGTTKSLKGTAKDARKAARGSARKAAKSVEGTAKALKKRTAAIVS